MFHLLVIVFFLSVFFATISSSVNNNNNISKALNPSVSNLHEAESAVRVQLKLSKQHIQLKPSKQRNQRRQKRKEKGGVGRSEGQCPDIK